jgi:thiol-disulfide isomerase/thioredoxin
MQSVINGEKNANTVKEELIAMKNPYLSMLLSMQIFRNNPEHINAYKAISTYANAQIKNSNDVAAFTNMVAMLSNPPAANLPDRNQNQGPQLNVTPGQVAPDIAMQDPNGKTRSLSSLRGKVVLLDFWASWCRPCRAANPHVVDLYNKYKNKGFTVFSVSLDRENGKDKWIQAIKDDGLIWENHVSDLKFWSSEAARTYGINSIPQTLLVDKSGKIAAIIPQGVSPESYIVAALAK